MYLHLNRVDIDVIVITQRTISRFHRTLWTRRFAWSLGLLRTDGRTLVIAASNDYRFVTQLLKRAELCSRELCISEDWRNNASPALTPWRANKFNLKVWFYLFPPFVEVRLNFQLVCLEPVFANILNIHGHDRQRLTDVMLHPQH